ncbi:MAG: DMT family transporter [Granulosicoccus sp.]
MKAILIGVAIALGGIGVLTMMDAVAKLIVSGELHLMQILFVRSAIIVTGMLSVYRFRSTSTNLKPVKWGLQIIRGLIGSIAPIAFFSALRYLPLTDATVIAYTSVFFTTILSAIVLRERVGIWRWSAILIGYAGVLLAIPPDGDGAWFGYFLVLIASLAYSTLAISGKWLTRSESTASLVIIYNLCVAAVTLFWLPTVWQPLSLSQITPLALFGLMAVVGQFMLVEAYRRLDGSLMAPLEYTSLAWAIALDILIWNDVPGPRVLLGAFIIIAASLFVIHREHLRMNARANHGTPE